MTYPSTTPSHQDYAYAYAQTEPGMSPGCIYGDGEHDHRDATAMLALAYAASDGRAKPTIDEIHAAATATVNADSREIADEITASIRSEWPGYQPPIFPED